MDGDTMKTEAQSIPKPFDNCERLLFGDAPCFLCGYSGPGYFQTATHPCAARFHTGEEEREHAVAKAAVGALTITRGQWIHSVNAEQCLSALREIEESGWTP